MDFERQKEYYRAVRDCWKFFRERAAGAESWKVEDWDAAFKEAERLCKRHESVDFAARKLIVVFLEILQVESGDLFRQSSPEERRYP